MYSNANMNGALYQFALHYKCDRSTCIEIYSDGLENFFALSAYARKYNEPLYAYLFYHKAA